MASTLLVTGIHREELAFGDHVSELVDRNRVDILRVPEGISHTKDGTADEFYYTIKHREIYLQLRQQVKRDYALVIDLHCGESQQGLYAEIFSHDVNLLQCLTKQLGQHDLETSVRCIQIIAEQTRQPGNDLAANEHPKARTWIPESVWSGRDFRYVGLEIFLEDGERGSKAELRFTRELIEIILACGT